MSLQEKLKDFSGSISTATGDAPDEYPQWSSWTYETHMADLRELWAEIYPQLKNLEQGGVGRCEVTGDDHCLRCCGEGEGSGCGLVPL